jgi:hypothetical protein
VCAARAHTTLHAADAHGLWVGLAHGLCRPWARLMLALGRPCDAIQTVCHKRM